MNTSALRRLMYVYHLQRVPSLGPGYWIILNRWYKPLGLGSRIKVDYEKYAVKLSLTKALAQRVSWKNIEGDEWQTKGVWLYNDGCLPDSTHEAWESYQKRLRTLMRCDLSELQHEDWAAGHRRVLPAVRAAAAKQRTLIDLK